MPSFESKTMKRRWMKMKPQWVENGMWKQKQLLIELTFTTATRTARGHKSQSDINDEELQPQASDLPFSIASRPRGTALITSPTGPFPWAGVLRVWRFAAVHQ